MISIVTVYRCDKLLITGDNYVQEEDSKMGQMIYHRRRLKRNKRTVNPLTWTTQKCVLFLQDVWTSKKWVPFLQTDSNVYLAYNRTNCKESRKQQTKKSGRYLLETFIYFNLITVNIFIIKYKKVKHHSWDMSRLINRSFTSLSLSSSAENHICFVGH